MSTNEPSGQESVGETQSIAHSVCHDCEYEQLHRARRPADAKQLAVEAAIEHGRESGHEVGEGVVDRPTMTVTTGPEAKETEVLRR